jgi:hypothetical protein
LSFCEFIVDSQKAFNLADCSKPSFWRTPESSNIMVLLDAGVRRHDGKLLFPIFCDAICFAFENKQGKKSCGKHTMIGGCIQGATKTASFHMRKPKGTGAP